MMTKDDIEKHNKKYYRDQKLFWVILFIVAFGAPIIQFIQSLFG